jgi:hypothetical protein
MKKWLRETHGPGFELARHFLLRFFDSDLITTPGQIGRPLIGVFTLLLPWFPVLMGPLKHKYAHFSSLAVPGPYREALRADELWLITLMMSAIGLLTAIKWQSLFPSLRDYRALGSLPVRARQIFGAKLAVLLLLTTAAVVVLNLVPSVSFPALSSSRWAINPSLGARVVAHAGSCVAACYFFFFGMLALQGLLLNLLRPRLFARVTGSLQGLLVAAMLILMVLSFSVQAQVANAALRPELARWLPPVWFLGLYQSLMGDRDVTMQALAHRAEAALLMAVVLALGTYAVSYGRHRKLLVEGMATNRKKWPWIGGLFDWLVRDPRQQAVMVFMTKTLAGSSQHRVILMGYGGFGVAILLSGLIGIGSVVGPAKVPAACFIYAHTTLLVFLLVGLRHLFSLPAELKANWMFQITEGEGRRQWLRAVDRLVFFWGAVWMLAIPFPLEARLLGWRAVGEVALIVAAGGLAYDWSFSSWEKLPFTCSYLPGRTEAWVILLRLIGLLAALQLANALLLACLYHWVVFLVVMVVVIAVWARVHVMRRDGWGEMRLRYDEVPEPAVHGLNLMR